MELNEFIRHVSRRWYVVILLLATAIAGTWVYHTLTGQKTATAVVAVLYARVAAPGEYLPPLISFEAIDESRELSARVADRLNDGSDPEDLMGKLSIDIQISTKPTLTPLYEVSFQDPDGERATRVANIVLEEGTKLFAELNSPTDKDVRAAFAPELARLETDVANAQAELTKFEQENAAANLPARRDQIRGYTNQLRLLKVQLDAGQVSASSLSDGPILGAARTELNRLTALEPEYSRLKLESDISLTDVLRLEGRVTDLSLAGPAAASVLADAQRQLESAKARQIAAVEALSRFRQTNGVADVVSSRQAQLTLVNQLTLSETSTRTGSSSITAALAAEVRVLARLEALEPRYNELALKLARVSVQQASLEQRIVDIVGGQTLPAETQVKVLDRATIQSSFFWFFVTYALAILVAFFVSFTLIYVLGVLEPMRPTVQDIEGFFGIPVLAHVPSRTEDGR